MLLFNPLFSFQFSQDPSPLNGASCILTWIIPQLTQSVNFLINPYTQKFVSYVILDKIKVTIATTTRTFLIQVVTVL